MESVNLIEAWQMWFAGEQTIDRDMWGIQILWWGRIGKVIGLAGSALLIAEIIGSHRLRTFGKSLRTPIFDRSFFIPGRGLSNWTKEIYMVQSDIDDKYMIAIAAFWAVPAMVGGPALTGWFAYSFYRDNLLTLHDIWLPSSTIVALVTVAIGLLFWRKSGNVPRHVYTIFLLAAGSLVVGIATNGKDFFDLSTEAFTMFGLALLLLLPAFGAVAITLVMVTTVLIFGGILLFFTGGLLLSLPTGSLAWGLDRPSIDRWIKAITLSFIFIGFHFDLLAS